MPSTWKAFTKGLLLKKKIILSYLGSLGTRGPKYDRHTTLKLMEIMARCQRHHTGHAWCQVNIGPSCFSVSFMSGVISMVVYCL